MDERSIGTGSVLHITTTDGRVDVSHLLDGNAEHTAESASEDDELHHAGDVYVVSVQRSRGVESVLCHAKPRHAAATVASIAYTRAEQTQNRDAAKGRSSGGERKGEGIS